MVSNRAQWCIVRCPESDCRGGCENIATKYAVSHDGGTRCFSIAADSAARHILFGGGGMAHSRLAAAEFGDSGV